MNKTHIIKAIAYQAMTRAIIEEYGKAAQFYPLLEKMGIAPHDIVTFKKDGYTITAETDFVVTFPNHTTMTVTALCDLDDIYGVRETRLKTYL